MSGYYVRGGNSDWILSRRARSGARRGVRRIMGVKRRKTRRRVVRADLPVAAIEAFARGEAENGRGHEYWLN